MSTPGAIDDGHDSPQPKKPLFARNRDFLKLWSGESISLFGSEISVIALPSLAVLTFGAGAFGVGMLVALQWLPFVLLAPLMGVLTDRMRRKPLMQIANVARFLILASLPLAYLMDSLTLQHLYVAAFLKGVFDVVFQLAYQAYMPEILEREDLADGNAKTQISRSVALMVGRSVGGALVSLIGAARAIFADALSYLVAVFVLRSIKHEEAPPEPSERGFAATMQDLKSGVKITFGNKLLRYLTLMATFGNMAVSLVLAMLVVFAYKELGFSGAQLGLALGIGAAPIVLGAIMSKTLNEKLGMGKTLILTHAMLGLAFVMLPLATLGSGKVWPFIVLVVCEGIASFTVPVANVGIMTLIQMATPPQAMGRVGGIALPFVWGSNAVGPLLGSAIVIATDVTGAFFFAALLAWAGAACVILGSVHKITNEVPEQDRVVV